MLRRNLTLPWRKPSSNSPDFTKSLQPWESVAVYNDALRNLRPTVYPLAFGEIRKLYGEAYKQVRAGTQISAPAIGSIKDQINTLLRQGMK